MRSTSRAPPVALVLQLDDAGRRAVTRPYSAATKKAFSRIKSATATSSKRIVTPDPVGVVLGGIRRPTRGKYRKRGCRHHHGRAILTDKPFQVRQGLCDGKTALGGLSSRPKTARDS